MSLYLWSRVVKMSRLFVYYHRGRKYNARVMLATIVTNVTIFSARVAMLFSLLVRYMRGSPPGCSWAGRGCYTFCTFFLFWK